MNRLLAAMENPLERCLEDNLEVLAPRPSGAGPEKSPPNRSSAEKPATPARPRASYSARFSASATMAIRRTRPFAAPTRARNQRLNAESGW